MKTLKNLFKPEDFSCVTNNGVYHSDKAQQILDQFIEENGVKVYGTILGESGLTDQHGPGAYNFCEKLTRMVHEESTHTAILIDIQPIKQCEHKRAVYVQDLRPRIDKAPGHKESWFECEECGKPVRAKSWESV